MTDTIRSATLTDERFDGAVEDLLGRVDRRLSDLLRTERARWCRVDPGLAIGFDLLGDFVARGGKRLRPRICLLAFLGAGGSPDDPRVVDLAAALEMLHTFALVHDDVMDGSDTRRHAPTVHRSVAELHRRCGWRGERRRFSEGMAVLIGDLAFAYSDRLLADLPPAVLRRFDEMRVELHVGQCLDLLAAASGDGGARRVVQVVRYKTAAYSVQRPLHLGALLADGSGTGPRPDEGALSAFGLAVGEAFQLRDDLLGVCGDPEVTGKPRGDDLRDGKETMVVHLARTWVGASGTADDRHLLARLGADDLSSDEVDALADLLRRSGAVAGVEDRVRACMAAAARALDRADLVEPAATALWELARRCAWRDR